MEPPKGVLQTVVWLAIVCGFLWGCVTGFGLPFPVGQLLVVVPLALGIWDDAATTREAAKRSAERP